MKVTVIRIIVVPKEKKTKRIGNLGNQDHRDYKIRRRDMETRRDLLLLRLQ